MTYDLHRRASQIDHDGQALPHRGGHVGTQYDVLRPVHELDAPSLEDLDGDEVRQGYFNRCCYKT